MGFDKVIYSRKILAVILFIYFLNYIIGDSLVSLFRLETQSVLQQLEFWRLFTFPLTYGSLEAILLFAFTFYFVAPRLEEKLKSGFIFLLIPLLILSHGIIHTLLFWDSKVILSGFEGVSIALVTIYTLLEPRQKVRLWLIQPQKLLFVFFSVILLWIGLKYFHSYNHGINILLQAFSSVSFGLISATLAFLHLITLRKIFRKTDNYQYTSFRKIDETKKLALMPEGRYEKYKMLPEDNIGDDSDDSDFSENRLNEILDKILEHGKDSLTYDDLRFLDNYSKQL